MARNGISCGLRAARENFGQKLRRKATRPANQVQGGQRPGAHGVDVGEGVGRSDPAPIMWIVDDRGDEVGGEADRQIIRDRDRSRIVECFRADKQPRIDGGYQTCNNLGKVART